MSDKIYIAGKITGIEAQAKTMFAQAELVLKQQGFTPMNPMALPHLHDKQWHSYMRECLKTLCDCDAILLLHTWQDSPGAKLEYSVAVGLGLDVYLEKEIEPRIVRVG